MNYDESKKAFITLVESVAYRYRTWEVFSDFCRMSAISLYQPFARDTALEEEYLQCVGKYEKKELEIFPRLFALVVEALSDRMGDFLGECFMDLNLGAKFKGQFFTPYYLSKTMALMLGINSNEQEGFCEPAVGSGGMVIARADALLEQGVNYQEVMEVQAIDVDSLCVDMTYIHLTLLHISAEVIHGNSLSLEVFRTWYTPAYIMRASKRQFLKSDVMDEELVKVKVPDDTNQNKMIYTDSDLEVFATGKLF